MASRGRVEQSGVIVTQLSSDQQPTAQSSRLPLRLVVLSIVGLWLTYFVLVTLRGVVVGLEFQEALLWRRLTVCLAGGGITFGMWLVLRLVDASGASARPELP